ncbi:hypothetical protein NL676_013458 [Syzygium grande]|nr:hypothetical protein NL676_013458 [Syzygium grande]
MPLQKEGQEEQKWKARSYKREGPEVPRRGTRQQARERSATGRPRQFRGSSHKPNFPLMEQEKEELFGG